MPRRLFCFTALVVCFVGCKDVPPNPEAAAPDKPVTKKPVTNPAPPAPAPQSRLPPAEQPDAKPAVAPPAAKETKPPERVVASSEVPAELRAEAQAQPDNRLVVLGQSNLPAETKLEIAVTSAALEKPLRASTALRPDGTFRTSPLGGKEGIAAGSYTIRVEVSPLRFQPSKVRSQFQNMDENLHGPMMNGPNGPVMGVEFEFQK